MEKPIQSFQDLSLQTDMLYGTVEKTSIHDYLKLKSDEDESSQKGSQYDTQPLIFRMVPLYTVFNHTVSVPNKVMLLSA